MFFNYILPKSAKIPCSTYPLVNKQFAIENGDLVRGFTQLDSMVDLSIVFC